MVITYRDRIKWGKIKHTEIILLPRWNCNTIFTPHYSQKWQMNHQSMEFKILRQFRMQLTPSWPYTVDTLVTLQFIGSEFNENGIILFNFMAKTNCILQNLSIIKSRVIWTLAESSIGYLAFQYLLAHPHIFHSIWLLRYFYHSMITKRSKLSSFWIQYWESYLLIEFN